MKTEESLRFWKLDNPRYATLTQYPERLIRSLYEDCSPDRFRDVNSAAEEISATYELNLKVIKHSLIQEWLPPIEQILMDDYYADDSAENGPSSKYNTTQFLYRSF